jgi:anti-sigma regulatory factor (Ser/Thr protein kinase)
MVTQAFPAGPESVPAARRYVTEMLDRVPAGPTGTAALLVSELASNAVRHAGGSEFEVEVQAFPDEGRVWVGFTDRDSGLPVLRAPADTAEHGRGLHLVGRLADSWGARRRRFSAEKTVWFELRYAGGNPASANRPV